MNLLKGLSWVLFFSLVMSCATKRLTIKGTEGSIASLASFENLTKDDKVLGKVPVEIPLGDVVGKVIRVSKDGRQSAYWLVVEASGERTELTVELPESKEGIGSKQNSVPINQILRLTLNAYQELGRGKFEEAKQLAQKAGELAPEAAAPQAIIGISLAKSGDMTGSRAAFLKAKSLDPDDASIPSLMSSLGVK